MRGSITLTIPMFDLLVENAKLLVSALVLDTQLKMVVLPMFDNPMIPHFNAIIISFEC
jgi:hypothetical protein